MFFIPLLCTTYLQTLKILLSIRDTILDNFLNLLTLALIQR